MRSKRLLRGIQDLREALATADRSYAKPLRYERRQSEQGRFTAMHSNAYNPSMRFKHKALFLPRM